VFSIVLNQFFASLVGDTLFNKKSSVSSRLDYLQCLRACLFVVMKLDDSWLNVVLGTACFVT